MLDSQTLGYYIYFRGKNVVQKEEEACVVYTVSFLSSDVANILPSPVSAFLE